MTGRRKRAKEMKQGKKGGIHDTGEGIEREKVEREGEEKL